MESKKKYLFFQKFRLTHLLFLIFLIIALIKKAVQLYFDNSPKLAIDFLKLYLYNIGDFLSIIPLLIMKKNIKNKNTINNIEENEEQYKRKTDIDYIYNGPEDYRDFKKIFLKIFVFTLVDFIAQVLDIIFYVIKEDRNIQVKRINLNSTLIFNIISIILFSRCILNTKFYKHHFFAFLINIFFLIILTIVDIYQINNEKEGNITMSIIFIFIKIISIILYSFENVLVKYILYYYYMSTYSLLLIKSIFHFTYLITFSFPFFFKEVDENGESKIVFYMIADIFSDKKYIFIAIGFTIVSFFYNNLMFKIIDFFSPNHFVISRTLENIGTFFIDLFMNGYDSKFFLSIQIVVHFFLIIAALIFNEFLVINICGLSKNTKLFLDYEVEREINNELKSDDNTSDNDNHTNAALIEEVE